MENELQFISECFNLSYRETSNARVNRLIKDKLNWHLILKRLVISGISPLAFQNISALKNPGIPEWFLNKLENVYNYTIIKNLYLWKALTEILDCFSKENIPALPLKGVFMVDVIYENIALRPLGDIDILVNESDLLQIEYVLSKKGCIKLGDDHSTTQYEYRPNNYPAENQGILLELHYQIDLPTTFSIPTDFLWLNARIKNIEGQKVLYPSIEDGIIYAALHFFQHFCNTIVYHSSLPQLKSILDIHVIVLKNSQEINWDYILRVTEKYKIKYVLYFSFFLLKKYFSTPIPANAERILKPNFLRTMVLRSFLRNYCDIQNTHSSETMRPLIMCVYFALLEKPYFISFFKKFFRPIHQFAQEYKLPYPSWRTLINYALRPVFWLVNIFHLKNVYQRNNSRS